jgi:transposase
LTWPATSPTVVAPSRDRGAKPRITSPAPFSGTPAATASWQIDRETLPNLDLHLIADNYSTHKTPAVQRWLKRHPRFKLHFIPTSCSWLNLVERLSAEITRQVPSYSIRNA